MSLQVESKGSAGCMRPDCARPCTPPEGLKVPKYRIRGVSILGILITLGLQIAQSRPYLHTLGPKVGLIYIDGAPGLWLGVNQLTWTLRAMSFEPPLLPTLTRRLK